MKGERIKSIADEANNFSDRLTKYDDALYVDLDNAIKIIEKEKGCSIFFKQIDIQDIARNTKDEKMASCDAFILTMPIEGKRTHYIGVEKDRSIFFKRFCLAHELAHLLLEHTDKGLEDGLSVCTHNACSYGYETGDDVEDEANIFALVLLVPTNTCEIVSDIINSDYSMIKGFSDLMRVSEDAMLARVKLFKEYHV